jgi:hypothetical protein
MPDVSRPVADIQMVGPLGRVRLREAGIPQTDSPPA